MKISLFSVKNDLSVRTTTFIKEIEVNFLPMKDTHYYDKENSEAYAFASIYFNEGKTCAIVTKLDPSRLDKVAEMF